MNWVYWVAAACVYAEFVGYWVHILLHGHRIRFLSRAHMIHHLVVYSPDRSLRPSSEYLGSTQGRAHVVGIGLEWLAPLGLILAATAAALRAAGAAPGHEAAFLATALAWGYGMFGVMHDRMHVRGSRWENLPGIGAWFRRVRRLHDIHHLRLTDDGTMAYNYGICFFVFDRLFGSLRQDHARFNPVGFAAAKRRYAFVFSAR